MPRTFTLEYGMYDGENEACTAIVMVSSFPQATDDYFGWWKREGERGEVR